MTWIQSRSAPRETVLVCTLILLGVARFASAWENGSSAPAGTPSPKRAVLVWAAADPAAPKQLSEEQPRVAPVQAGPLKPVPPADVADASGAQKGFDPALVAAGQMAFEQHCTKCHAAERALSRSKELAGWRATVRRMASRQGANIPPTEIEPIATYLAARSTEPAVDGAAPRGEFGVKPDTSSLSAFVTASPLWRGGNSHVQNPDFFPQAWAGASWQGKVLSVRVTACTACHGAPQADPAAILVSRIELVEALARVDLSPYADKIVSGALCSVEAGRLIVPFGAFSAQVNPSLYRTVSTPLIFNMGQRVFKDALGEPVLPMPYADEGVNLNMVLPVADLATGLITAAWDGYLVNGLTGEQSQGIEFYNSRNLSDSNFTVAEGGRFTLGGPNVRAGTSITHGSFTDPTLTSDLIPGKALTYTIYGFDIQAHYEDLVRFQLEWARRDNQRATTNTPTGTALLFTERIDGYYLEGEVRPWRKARVSLLGRYDRLNRNSREPPPFSTLPTGTFSVQRSTLGLNVQLWRQSLLMFNWEHWYLPEGLKRNLDLYGVRYAITF